jgi:hypothetical protein
MGTLTVIGETILAIFGGPVGLAIAVILFIFDTLTA